MALKKPMQRGPRQVGNRRLQRVEAIIEGQERASTELDDQRFLVGRQHRRVRHLRPHRTVLEACAPPPLGHRLGIDPVALAQRLDRSLRSLYCCSDGVSGRGASVKYLSHSVSLVVAINRAITTTLWD